jgi:uncharacterized membrane protein required for colicin V production
LDWFVLVLIGLFALRGVLQGAISQSFALLGLFAGLWVAGWIAPWLSAHWSNARPAAAFSVLRWCVIILAVLMHRDLHHDRH